MQQDPNRDGLTKLWNRKYVFAKLEEWVGSGVQVALILIDIDRFKYFNDSFGLGRGNEILLQVAHEIEAASGENALVSRFGGDVFGGILPETSLQTAREIAEKIRAARQPMTLKTYDGKEVVALTLSLGIAQFSTHVSSAENLLAAADLALMKAKGEGSSRWSDGTSYTGRNRVMAIGDFFDDFPKQSARFLR